MKRKNETFIKIIKVISQNATCHKHSVGAVIVRDGRIVASGYNGSPSKTFECEENEVLVNLLNALKYLCYSLIEHTSSENIAKDLNISTKYHVSDFNQLIDKMYEGKIKLNDLNVIRDKFLSLFSGSIHYDFARSKFEMYNKYISKYKEISTKYDYETIHFILKVMIKFYKDKKEFINIVHSRYEVHAEMNAISLAAKHGISLEGCELYCTHKPCLECAKIIVSAGIKKVYYIYDYVDRRFQESSETFFKLSNVEIENVPDIS